MICVQNQCSAAQKIGPTWAPIVYQLTRLRCGIHHIQCSSKHSRELQCSETQRSQLCSLINKPHGLSKLSPNWAPIVKIFGVNLSSCKIAYTTINAIENQFLYTIIAQQHEQFVKTQSQLGANSETPSMFTYPVEAQHIPRSALWQTQLRIALR